MSESKGWVKIHRGIAENWVWQTKPFSPGQAWIDLIMLVNHAPKKVRRNGRLVEIKRGQHVTSILKLAERWGWGRKKVSKFLDDLEYDKMLTQKRTTRDTTLTIENYGVYQYEEQQEEQPRNSRGTAEEQPRNTNKNEKNDKERKNKNNRGCFSPPSIDEVQGYCSERGNGITGEEFIDFYESKGWMVGKNKMKDWKSAVRTWESRRGFKPEKKEEIPLVIDGMELQ